MSAGAGLEVAIMEMPSTLLSVLLETVIGTTAPFSAISGAFSLTASDGLWALLPSELLSAPSTSLAAKASVA